MKNQAFITYFERFTEEQTKLINFNISKNTVRTYRVRTNNFKEFLIETNQLDLKAEQINIRHIKAFESWLKIKKNHSQDNTMKGIQFVKRMLEEALEDQAIELNPANKFKFKYEKKKKKEFLDMEQLNLLKECKLPTKHLIASRDIFLFACYTGFSYIDIKNFKKEYIKTGKDGSSLWLNIERQKTRSNNNDTLLPLLPGAKQILEKYEYKLPVPANSNMNLALKKIARLSGINIQLCTHTGRKTFGNILVNEFGIDIKSVSVMMGHKSLKTTEDWYVDVREKKITRDMQQVRVANW